jgi:hypothetical protein
MVPSLFTAGISEEVAHARDLLDDERRRQRVAASARVGLRDVDRVEIGLDQ